MKPHGKLFCFSPPVMLATILFEVGAAIFLLWKYKLSPKMRLIVLILLMLATFQVAEYMVCEGKGLNSVQWARVGYAAIGFLPPLGLHLMTKLLGRTHNALVGGSYLLALAFAAAFLFAPVPFYGQQCLGNYVIFQVHQVLTIAFGTFYYVVLFAALFVAATAGKATPTEARASRMLAIGYLAFLVPTAVVTMLQPDTLRGIPSIMCGFAVLLAVMLAFGVAPLVDRIKHKRHNSK